MNKVILIPDSFKGTMDSTEICKIMSNAIKTVSPTTNCISVPVADGGEGTVDAFLTAIGGEKIYVDVKGPYNEPIKAFYGVCGDVAIVEMAAAAGLPLVGENRNAEKTTTYGVGQLIAHAAEQKNVKRLILGLGGSATNDGGCGAAAALGVAFYNKDKQTFVPTGETLINIHSINADNVPQRLKEIPITIMCDIDNPLCGENGASAVFGPQKGADEEMVKRLDKGLNHLANIVEKDLDKSILNLSGAGAAGGMGAGMVGFFGASLQMGIETVLQTVGFDKLVENADMIFTGEGRIDGQSLRGKVVVGVARAAKKHNVPVIAVVGDIAKNAEQSYEQGVTSIFSINRLAVPYEKAKLTAKDDLYLTIINIMRSLTIK